MPFVRGQAFSSGLGIEYVRMRHGCLPSKKHAAYLQTDGRSVTIVGMKAATPRKPRTVLAPSQRRAEFVELAERLFRTKGYDATTINDVISEAGVSKGAFYHHFKAKEDLLEAIAARAATEVLSYFEHLKDNKALDALSRLNRLLAMGREWKLEHMGQLRRTFETDLRREDGVLAARMFESTFAVLSPAIASLIAQGQSAGVICEGDPGAMADALLWVSYGRERMTEGLLGLAEQDPEAFVERLHVRLSADQAIMDRVLGLPSGSIQLIGTPDDLKQFVVAWQKAAPPER